MKKIIQTILIMLVCYQAFGHGGKIMGKVCDSKNNSTIEYARVSIESLNYIVNTDLGGMFNFDNLASGKYLISVNSIGYTKKQIEVEVDDHQSKIITILLDKGVTRLKEVKIQTNQAANINTISKLDIGLRPVNTSQDILRMVPGLFIAQHAGGGKAEQIFLRGFDCDHGTDVALSVDGMPVNMVSHAHGQGYADLHFVIPETIDRVNVRKGPYNASVGNLATAGAVQFQTKNRLDNNLISLEGGQFNMMRGLAMFNLLGEKARQKDQNLYVVGEYFYRKGFFDRPDHLKRFNTMLKYHGLIAKHHRATISLTHFDSKWNASGQIPERAVNDGTISRFGSIDPTEGGNTGRTNASFKVVSDLHHGRFLSNQIFLNHYDFNLLSNFTFYKNDTVNGDKILQKEKRKIMGYNGAYYRTDKIGKLLFNTELGLQARFDQTKNTELSNVTKSNELLNRLSIGDIQEFNVGAYIQEEVDINKNLSINIGLREDFFVFGYSDKIKNTNQIQSKAIFLPKMNINYTLNKNVQVFLLSGVGFHSNDTRVVVAQNGKQILPPAYGAEIGSTMKPNNNCLITASVWWLKLQQEFVYVGDEAVVEPSGKTQRMGLDIGLRYEIFKWLYADADFNFSIPRALAVAKTENRIPLAPTNTAIGGLTAKWNNGLNASLRYRYLGNRPGNESNTLIAKGYFITDAVLQYNYKKMIFGLSAENIFNVKWKEAQFETESQLKTETEPVTEMHFTSGTPFFAKLKIGVRF